MNDIINAFYNRTLVHFMYIWIFLNYQIIICPGGETWTASKIVVWGLSPSWSPVLFYDQPSSRLFLFYSESRKYLSPGGDIRCIISADNGDTWSPPSTLYTHEADGEVPKVTSNRPAVADDGTWYLPFHTEPAGSYKVFNSKTWCPQKEAEGHRSSTMGTTAVPENAAPQGVVTAAGVMISRDRGQTWSVGGYVEDPKTWLIQPAAEWSAQHGLLLLSQTAAGKVYSARSLNNGTSWTRPTPCKLTNPNSKISTVSIDDQILLVHNPSASQMNQLAISLSLTHGKVWEHLSFVEQSKDDILCSPCIVAWADDTVKIAYTVWGKGLKLTTVKLVTVE